MIVRVHGLTKRFSVRRDWTATLRAPFAAPKALVVDRVSFDVREGEIFGLLGQNGAGKTTLFKMLSTLILADSGTATIGGFDVGHEAVAVRRLLAPVIANERTLYWRISAHENLRLYAALQGLHGAHADAEIRRVLSATDLQHTGTKMVGLFSTGMKQRLLIARALLGRPRVLLLDEPTRSLDPISARGFRRFLRDTVVRAEGCTVLLATHDTEEVWELCDRVGVLDRGRLLAVDATRELRDRAGSDRFRVWLRGVDGPAAIEDAMRAGLTLERRGPTVDAGWDEFECTISGGADGAARALAVIAGGARAVARLERATPSLADLIERVLATAPEGTNA